MVVCNVFLQKGDRTVFFCLAALSSPCLVPASCLRIFPDLHHARSVESFLLSYSFISVHLLLPKKQYTSNIDIFFLVVAFYCSIILFFGLGSPLILRLTLRITEVYVNGIEVPVWGCGCMSCYLIIYYWYVYIPGTWYM